MWLALSREFIGIHRYYVSHLARISRPALAARRD
jgi:hypothetical protein